MQRHISNKFSKKILCILILFVIIYTVFGFSNNIINRSYATTYTYTNKSNNLPSNFETKYPGYKALIQKLAKAHPKWTFKLYETGLNWETVINNEYQGHGGSPKNLVPASYAGGWICPICGTKAYDTGKWYCASREAIEYMMDPRNSINETDVFQFQDLASSTGDRTAIEAMVDGTFIDNKECVDAIFEAAKTYNVSPYHLVSRIIQEQGTKGSVLGLGIKKGNVTYYNLFNVGAAGNTEGKVIENGLNKAIEKGWTSMAKSIVGGAEFLVKNYIAIGQSTVYFQKFNVVYKDNLYGHQYMQNLLAAQNEGASIRKKYIDYGILDSSYTFLIPLYENMPSSPCTRPSDETPLEKGELVIVNAIGGLALRDAPNGRTLTYIADGTAISRLEKAKTKVGSYYWDKVSTPKGTGYMARMEADGSKTFLVPVEDKKYTTPDDDGIILVVPDATVSTIKKGYPTAIIVDKSGKEISGNTLLGTGAKIKIDGVETYTMVKLGDVSGDGEITPSDYVKVKNKIMGVTSMDSVTQKAADVNQDGKTTPADYVKIKNHIMKVSTIAIYKY